MRNELARAEVLRLQRIEGFRHDRPVPSTTSAPSARPRDELMKHQVRD